MARSTGQEPFPPLTPIHSAASQDQTSVSRSEDKTQRRRRKSSGLPGDPRGDTSAAALATITDQAQTVAGSQVNHTTPQSPQKPPLKRGQKGYKRRKAKSFFRRWKSLSVKHTWLNPLMVLLVPITIWLLRPGPDNPLHGAIFLSYPIPGTSSQEYGKGGWDFAFVAFWTIALSFTREFLMQRVIRPFAIRCGIRARGKQSRFMEQAYTAIYFSVFGPFGLYVLYRSPVWYFNTHGMFEGFPHKQHEGPFKAYYLLQAAYWTQQFIVLALQLEKPRKDFKELVAHHVVTIALIWLSYRFHFAFMGVVVFVTHDISDLFLAVSKCLNYLESRLTAVWFTTFIFVWGYCRHYMNLRLLYAVLTDFQTVGPFEVNWETQQYKCRLSQVITFSLLACIQALNLFWFFLILRIAKRMVLAHEVEDIRSEEDEGEEEGSTQQKREKLRLPAEAGRNGVLPNGVHDATPTVLLNGKPVEESQQTSAGARSTGRRSVEVKAQERHRVSK